MPLADDVCCHFTLLKNKIHPRTFEDLIGFIKPFMNKAASPPTSREMLQELYKMEGFDWCGGVVINQRKEVIDSGKVTFSKREGQGALKCTYYMCMKENAFSFMDDEESSYERLSYQ